MSWIKSEFSIFFHSPFFPFDWLGSFSHRWIYHCSMDLKCFQWCFFCIILWLPTRVFSSFSLFISAMEDGSRHQNIIKITFSHNKRARWDVKRWTCTHTQTRPLQSTSVVHHHHHANAVSPGSPSSVKIRPIRSSFYSFFTFDFTLSKLSCRASVALSFYRLLRVINLGWRSIEGGIVWELFMAITTKLFSTPWDILMSVEKGHLRVWRINFGRGGNRNIFVKIFRVLFGLLASTPLRWRRRFSVVTLLRPWQFTPESFSPWKDKVHRTQNRWNKDFFFGRQNLFFSLFRLTQLQSREASLNFSNFMEFSSFFTKVFSALVWIYDCVEKSFNLTNKFLENFLIVIYMHNSRRALALASQWNFKVHETVTKNWNDLSGKA